MARTIAITSGKGGTGKTMIAANLGATYSRMGKKVLLLDLDMGLRNLDLYLGLESKVVYDVSDVINGVCKIKQAIIQDKSFPNLHFMAAAPSANHGEITPFNVKALCEKLKETYDYVILDSSAGMEDGFMIAALCCDQAIIVINPEYSSLRDGEAVSEALKDKGVDNFCYVLNKVNMRLMNEGLCPVLDEFPASIRNKIAGIVEEDENVHISTNLGVPVVFVENSPIAKNFITICSRIDKSFF